MGFFGTLLLCIYFFPVVGHALSIQFFFIMDGNYETVSSFIYICIWWI